MPVLDTPEPTEYGYKHLWSELDWNPHPVQRRVMLEPVRNKVVALGRRAGKSQMGGHRLVPEAFRAGSEISTLKRKGLRREYWIVGPEYSDSEKEFRVIWNALSNLDFEFDHPGSYNNSETGTMVISLFDGQYIVHAKSAKYPTTLIGEGLSGVIMAEAAKLKPSVWYKYIRPTLADFNGWSMFNSTPEGKNWFYDLFMTGLDEDRPDWRAWRAPSWVNPYVYPGGCNVPLLRRAAEAKRRHELPMLIQAIKKSGNWNRKGHPSDIDPEIWSMFLDQSLEMFNQEIAALFTEFVGRVFKDFDEEIHVTKQDFNPAWETYACTDYGWTNPFVWLIVQIDPHHERVHILDEYYEYQKTTEEAGSEINDRGLAPRTVRAFFPDPAEPDRTRQLAQTLRIKPYNRGSIELHDRIEWIRRGLKYNPILGGPSLTIHSRCVNTIREFNDYRYKETAEQAGEKGKSAPELPQKKDDHTPEAIGRLYSGLFGSPWSGPGGGGARISKTKTKAEKENAKYRSRR